MNTKKIDQQERSRELERRLELEKMINETAGNLESATKEAYLALPHITSLALDYAEVKTIIDAESSKIVNSIAEFYLDPEIIENISYVKQKIKVDHITISSLLFQMRTAEHAITKLLAEIDNGNLHPRTFEVLASLQRSKMEIVKHMAQFMIIMENAYKNFKEDYRLKKAETQDTKTSENSEDEEDGIRTRGTRALLKTLAKIKKDQGIVENFKAEEISDDSIKFDSQDNGESHKDLDNETY